MGYETLKQVIPCG